MTVLERFLDYVAYPTMSDETSTTCPSTEKQWALAHRLVDDLLSLGLSDAHVDMYGYVYASIPPTAEGLPAIALFAHMDTAHEAPDAPVRARVVDYEGGDIELSEGIVMSPSAFPTLSELSGEHLVVTDGHTLLGGDDKAGIAEILTALERLLASGCPHGRVAVVLTPDEEIGRGCDHIDLSKIACDFGYTVDGGDPRELQYENFNAARAKIAIRGTPIHPGAAKGKMVNAARIAAELDAALPPEEIPELTEGREGFHHLLSITGDTAEAHLDYLIRDHDEAKFLRKKEDFCRLCEEANRRYGEGTVTLTLSDTYYNMASVHTAHPAALERARLAMRHVGLSPHCESIRGGTDGAALSFLGLPCPNLGTGTRHMHSVYELVSVEAMEKVTELLFTILTI